MTNLQGLWELGSRALAVVVLAGAGLGILLAAQWLSGRGGPRPARQATRRSRDAPRLRGRMRRLARDTLLLVPTSATGFSKLGGDPDLPPGASWPKVRGRPCAFLGQIDLSAFQPHMRLEWLPDAGRLYAFVDPEGYGYADQVQVSFHVEAPGEPRPPPLRALRFPERRVAFEQYASTPSLDWLGVDLTETDLTDAELDHLSNLPDAPFGDEIQHRIGGYPSEIQSEQMAIACEFARRDLLPSHTESEIAPAIRRAARAWRLLLQVDSDPALGMAWGDAGRLYVFVREQDAKAGRFSKTVTIHQTH
ncbi:YwqG family protein [Phenylobacterium sp. SCN 70-31]|uniref:YwqG family protein n=1 Tax=Phenylobacterium sp. SCN 70-31 TaxID=1660129 RepID=UPI000B289D04|nr:YwqG family protein [Phenylobacterium sp. SCN 70-31]